MPAQEGLRQGTVAGGTTRKQTLWRDSLVVGEIALTLSLLVAAGLMVRTLMSLRGTHVGFVADQVTTGQIYLPNHSAFFLGSKAVPTGPNLIQTFYAPLLDRLKAQPGVESVGLSTVRPLQANWDFNMSVELKGRPKPEHSNDSAVQVRATSADYFKALGIRLVAGRFFSTTDGATSQPVAIVNHTFVQRFFPGQDPLGQQVRFNDEGERQWATIVGVVDDTPQKTVGQPPMPEVNYDLTQFLPQDDSIRSSGASS